jgi:hypothetical protein
MAKRYTSESIWPLSVMEGRYEGVIKQNSQQFDRGG